MEQHVFMRPLLGIALCSMRLQAGLKKWRSKWRQLLRRREPTLGEAVRSLQSDGRLSVLVFRVTEQILRKTGAGPAVRHGGAAPPAIPECGGASYRPLSGGYQRHSQTAGAGPTDGYPKGGGERRGTGANGDTAAAPGGSAPDGGATSGKNRSGRGGAQARPGLAEQA